MAVRPHRVVDEGRVVLFEDGPLSYRDIGDTLIHVQHRHRRPAREAYISPAQRAEVLADEVFLHAYRGHADPIDQPNTIGRILGTAIIVGRPEPPARGMAYIHPRDWERWYNGTGNRYVATNTTAQANMVFDAATWKVQFGDAVWGKKLDGVWFDEPKPKPPTTHENW